MKNYRALRFIAGILRLCGWLTIAFGVLFIVVTLRGGHPESIDQPYDPSSTLMVLIPLLIGGGFFLLGILILAAAELIQAVVHIAINSASLPLIEQHTEKTVGFFEHISGRANVTPAAPTRS